jgi:hypothetical protein
MADQRCWGDHDSYLEVTMRRRMTIFGILAFALVACGEMQSTGSQSTQPANDSTNSQQGAAAGTSSGPNPTAPAQSSEARCTAAVLDGRIEITDPGAGNRHGKLIVTNTNSASCTLNGYGGLQLLDANGQQVPTNLQRTTDPGPSPVTLASGKSAVANLHWVVIPTGNEPQTGPCQPEAAKAESIPPGETVPMQLNWGFGSVCDGGKIEISAFYAA